MPRKSPRSTDSSSTPDTPAIEPLNSISDIPDNPFNHKEPDVRIKADQPDVDPVPEPQKPLAKGDPDYNVLDNKPDNDLVDGLDDDWKYIHDTEIDLIQNSNVDTSPDLRGRNFKNRVNPLDGVDLSGLVGPNGVYNNQDPFRRVETRLDLDYSDPDRPSARIRQDRQIRPIDSLDIGRRQRRAR